MLLPLIDRIEKRFLSLIKLLTLEDEDERKRERHVNAYEKKRRKKKKGVRKNGIGKRKDIELVREISIFDVPCIIRSGIYEP